MRRAVAVSLVAILAAAWAGVGFRPVPYVDADQIMQKVKDTHGANAEVDVVKMVSVNSSGDVETREVFSAVQKDAAGNYRYLLRFLSPADVKGVTLLVVDKPAGDSDQYLYLPSLGKVNQITGAQRSQAFMGSDFTFEDLRKEKPDEWTYARLQDEKVEGADCYVILSEPADKNRELITGYTNRVMYVDKNTYDIRRIEFFDSKNKPIKVFDARDYETQPGGALRPKTATMTNKAKKTNTIMTLLNSRINQPLDDKFFTVETIQNWGPEQEKVVDGLLGTPAPAPTPAPAAKTP